MHVSEPAGFRVPNRWPGRARRFRVQAWKYWEVGWHPYGYHLWVSTSGLVGALSPQDLSGEQKFQRTVHGEIASGLRLVRDIE